MVRAFFQKGTLMMHVGDRDHLHLVMNDPLYCPVLGIQAVLMVAISSVRAGSYVDPACLLDVGDHPFIRHQSFVYYRDSNVFNADRLQMGVEAGDLQPRETLSLEVFRRVRDGFYAEPRQHNSKVSRFIKQRLEPDFKKI